MKEVVAGVMSWAWRDSGGFIVFVLKKKEGIGVGGRIIKGEELPLFLLWKQEIDIRCGG